MLRHLRRAFLLVLLTLVVLRPAAAALTPAAQQELQAANQAAQAALQKGPQDIKLIDQAVLKLPVGYGFIPKAQADRLMQAYGNGNDPDRLGLVVPLDDRDWLIDLEYLKSGYIKDDDAKHWDVDQLLQNIKDGTEEANKDRVTRGFPELEIVGWVQKPEYTESSHELIWSIQGRHKGDQPGADNINYNTYMLGREGYISMDMITSLVEVQAYSADARNLLGDLSFDSGKRYQDFDSSTDKVAEYGLAALVGGIAIKKLGLFALIASFFIKIWKLILVGFFAVSAAVRKFFKKRKDELLPPPPPGNVT